MGVSTPIELTAEVRDFCRRNNSACKLSWIEVRPTDKAVASQCYYNVADHIKDEGEKIIFGWLIWESSGNFIEAEHHAIWEGRGLCLDIPPKQDGEEKILFLHDPSKRYIFKKPNWRVNIRKSTHSDSSVQNWLEVKTTLDKLINKYSHPNGRGRATTIKREQMGHYNNLNSAVTAALYKMNTPT